MAQSHPWQLKAPTEDGQVLLWPEGRRWRELAEQTHHRLAAASTVRLLDLPLPEARRLARQSLPALGSGIPTDVDQLWFVTGHQTFPYHPGIWAKSVAIDAAAGSGSDCLAVNLDVDHDLPHAGPQICWPAVQPDGQVVRRGELGLDHRQPFERQPAPSPQQVDQVCQAVAGDLRPLLGEQQSCPFQLDGEPDSKSHFGEWFARTRVRLDERIGLRLVDALTSRLAEQDMFLLFVADAMARAASLHVAYNRAIQECEQLTGRLPATPLQAEGERVELPFWTLRPEEIGRHRLFVSAAHGAVTISDDIGEIGQLPASDLVAAGRAVDRLRQVLQGQDVHLRPRALTLTLFARLLLADLFVHGVGGGTYDYAADVLCQQHYGLAAPPFSVASATLLLPLDVATATAGQLRQARWALRDMHFNPQRHLSADLLAVEATNQAVRDKWSQVGRNDQLRLDGISQANHRQRYELFLAVRQLNQQLADLLADRVGTQANLVGQLSQRQQAGQVVLARDYFYGLFPQAKLDRLRETIRGLIA